MDSAPKNLEPDMDHLYQSNDSPHPKRGVLSGANSNDQILTLRPPSGLSKIRSQDNSAGLKKQASIREKPRKMSIMMDDDDVRSAKARFMEELKEDGN